LSFVLPGQAQLHSFLPYPAVAGVQYAGASRSKRTPCGYWITRLHGWWQPNLCPARRCGNLAADAIPKHFCARGRIALSGVDLRPQGPGGGSKRTSFRRLRPL